MEIKPGSTGSFNVHAEAPALNFLNVETNSGASFSIASILYLFKVDIGVLLSCCFFDIKYVSSSTLFLSEEGKDNQILPSSA